MEVKTLPHSGPWGFTSSDQGSPQPAFPRAFVDTWSQTQVVGWCPPWLFLHFCMQLVCGVVAALEEAGSLFMFWLTPSHFEENYEEKYAFVLFCFPTWFQTYYNFCQPCCTLSPSLHVFAMSQKLVISPATACSLCTGRKQEATGKPEDFHEA